MSHQQLLGLLVVLAIIGGIIISRQALAPNNLLAIQLKGTSFSVEVANNSSTRAQGLSGRPALAPNQGMLFVFPADTKPGFWMKEMNFSIDIVWLDSSGAVVGIISHLKPDSYPQKFYPSQPIRYVLELPAGLTDQLQLKTGDIIHLNA